MVFSRDGTIVDVNAAITRISGAARERVIGAHYSAFLDPDDVPRHRAYLERALKGDMLNYRARARTLAGNPLELTITTVPEYRNGAIFGAFSIIRDVTDEIAAREQIEQQELALADKEARLRSLFAHNPDGVISLALDGTILDINDAGIALGNYPRNAVVGQAFAAFIAPASLDAAMAAFAGAMAKGLTGVLSLNAMRVDGTVLELNATLLPQYEAGAVVGVYAIVQDQSERKAAERRVDLIHQRIRELYFIAAGGDFPEQRMRASLELGAKVFDASVGAVVDLSGERPEVGAIYRDSATQFDRGSTPHRDRSCGVCAPGYAASNARRRCRRATTRSRGRAPRGADRRERSGCDSGVRVDGCRSSRPDLDVDRRNDRPQPPARKVAHHGVQRSPHRAAKSLATRRTPARCH